jgi:hypothetical protein
MAPIRAQIKRTVPPPAWCACSNGCVVTRPVANRVNFCSAFVKARASVLESCWSSAACTASTASMAREASAFRRDRLHPPVDRHMVDGDAALGQQLLHVAVGRVVAHAPTRRDRDHRTRGPVASRAGRIPDLELIIGSVFRSARTTNATAAPPHLLRIAGRDHLPSTVDHRMVVRT